MAEIATRLAEATHTPHHEFWPDEISIPDSARFEQSRWLNSRQITDAYLLGLAMQRGGAFVTLDRSIDRSLVRGAASQHLVAI